MPEGPIKGYIRADAGLSVRATDVVLDLAAPLKGYLEIATEDGRLRLAITGGAAADLLIDLKNFLAMEQKGQ
jgi:hypothetical protein